MELRIQLSPISPRIVVEVVDGDTVLYHVESDDLSQLTAIAAEAKLVIPPPDPLFQD